jgi:lysocardiolipin and lysophospholipid acyltransferase
MQFFRFIFLKRNWLSDKKPLAKHLAFMASLGRKASREPLRTSTTTLRGAANKLLLLVYPEGTLVS